MIRDRRPLVRIAPVEFGWGPLGKALHLARAMRTAVGNGVRLELCATERMSSAVERDLFDDIIGSLDQEVKADAVLTLMNVAGVNQAALRGERVFVVDSLAWLWDSPLPVSGAAYRYYYQDLPVLPVPPRNLVGLPEPLPVSAIVGESTYERQPDAEPSGGLVVSFSGLESRHTRLEDGTLVYPSFFLGGIEKLLEREIGMNERMSIFGNSGILYAVSGPRVKSCLRGSGQREFLSAARQASNTVISPGLTSIVELLAMGARVQLMPAQNFSQIKIHRAFTGAGVPGLGWGSELEPWLAGAVLPEPVGANIVSGLIAAQKLSRSYADPDDLAALFSARPRRMEASRVEELLGKADGARTIAASLLSHL